MISIHNIAALTARASAVEGGNWIDLDFVGAYSTDVPTTITLYFNEVAPGQLEALCNAINHYAPVDLGPPPDSLRHEGDHGDPTEGPLDEVPF